MVVLVYEHEHLSNYLNCVAVEFIGEYLGEFMKISSLVRGFPPILGSQVDPSVIVRQFTDDLACVVRVNRST